VLGWGVDAATLWPSYAPARTGTIHVGRRDTLRGEYAERRKNTILYSDLASKWNILEPINGISLNILGYSMIFHLWASPRNIHIRIPHVGATHISKFERSDSILLEDYTRKGEATSRRNLKGALQLLSNRSK